ncbi:hypothetical protein BLOT_007589 [Blomia tropicalis]|nr:hypothetical protein BLOT_007589 [Blomia tropicalis]
MLFPINLLNYFILTLLNTKRNRLKPIDRLQSTPMNIDDNQCRFINFAIIVLKILNFFYWQHDILTLMHLTRN